MSVFPFLLQPLRRLSGALTARPGARRGSSTSGEIGRLARLIEGHRDERIEYVALCLKLGLRARALTAIRSLDVSHLPTDVRFRLALVEGDIAKAVELLDPHRTAQSLKHASRGSVSRLIALATPVAPHRTLALVKAVDAAHASRAALELAVGKVADCRQTLAQRGASIGPDRWLLESNLGPPASRLGALNCYFAEHGLSEVGMIDPNADLGINNLASLGIKASAVSDEPLVSVVMTTYNSAKYLRASVDSVLRQSHRNLELILVDDGSTDETPGMLDSFDPAGRRIKVARLPRNVGTYAAKNVGLGLAEGEFVAFNDADDWCHPDRFRHCLAALSEHPGRVALTCHYVRLADDGVFVSNKIWPITRWSPNSLLFRRKAVVSSIGYFEEVRFGADSEYVTRLRLALGEKSHLRLTAPLVVAAHHPASLTNARGTAVQPHGHAGVRIEYQELWIERLLGKLARGEPLCLSAEPANESAARSQTLPAASDRLTQAPSSH